MPRSYPAESQKAVKLGEKDALPPREVELHLKYPNTSTSIKITSLQPPAYFIWTHGAGNSMNDRMNRMFNLGFAKVSSIVGIDRPGDGNGGVQLLTAFLKKQPEVNAIGGRSAGSMHAVNTILSKGAPNVKNLVVLSYLFANGAALKKVPKDVNILVLFGDRDYAGVREDGNGKYVTATWDWIDRNMQDHKVWRVVLRHASHGSNLEAKHGGVEASDAILQIAGQVTAGWLCGESRSDDGNREGAVWYDVNEEAAYWSGWQPQFNLETAAEWKI